MEKVKRTSPEPLAARVFLCVALAPPRCETNACKFVIATGPHATSLSHISIGVDFCDVGFPGSTLLWTCQLNVAILARRCLFVFKQSSSLSFCFVIRRWRSMRSWGMRLAIMQPLLLSLLLLLGRGHCPGCNNLQRKPRTRRPASFENVLAIKLYKSRASALCQCNVGCLAVE